MAGSVIIRLLGEKNCVIVPFYLSTVYITVV